jgi:hypothetical protein
MSRALDPLRSALAAERIGAWIGAVVFELCAMGIVLPFSAKFRLLINMGDLKEGAWVIGIFGAGLALAGAWFARKALLQRDIDRTPMMLKLLHDPDDVVWVHAGSGVEYRVYGQTTHRSRFLCVLCESQKNHVLELPERKVREILHELERYLPHARIGDFSQALLAQYRADPKSLRLVDRTDARESAGYREPAKPKEKTIPRPLRAPFVLVAIVAVALMWIAPLLYERLAPVPTTDESSAI